MTWLGAGTITAVATTTTVATTTAIVITSPVAQAQDRVPYAPRQERVVDFAALVSFQAPSSDRVADVRVERVTAGVPWPRGLALVDGQLVVLARGRHRRAGGVDATIPDRCGTLLLVDIDKSEPVVPGKIASEEIRNNARVLATPSDKPFFLYRPSVPPIQDVTMDRPYCTLIYDPRSRNLFTCGYSGVDLPGAKFRKNATDSIHRYDLRNQRWHTVELHDHRVVPKDQLSYVVPNQYYPHHDPARNAAPHGWLNGPDGGCVAGDYLYCVGKDNHSVARYDLEQVRKNPNAAAPKSQLVMGPRVRVRYADKTTGGMTTREMEVLGASAAALWDDYLYLGYRTSSVVLRFPVQRDGQVTPPGDGGLPVGELVAVFEPWDARKKRSANLIDIAFNSRGELFVSCARQGRIWKVGRPDPQAPFFGNDQAGTETSRPPYVDLRQFTGKKTGCGNLLFDDKDRLYLCVGNYDAGTRLAGAVYRVVEQR